MRKKPKAIADRQVKKLHSKEIAMVKVIWQNHSNEEATWEPKEDMRVKYPQLLQK